jgi:hypothetical protein
VSRPARAAGLLPVIRGIYSPVRFFRDKTRRRQFVEQNAS